MDRSGSMRGLEADTIGGFNAMLEKQRRGGAIHHIGNVHKYAREEDRPEKTLFVITTDGQENPSRQYSYERVKQMVERQKERYGWEFLFLGANIDAVEVAGRFGINTNRAVRYESDREGTQLNYQFLNETVSVMRCARSAAEAACVMDAKEFLAPIQEDYKKRGKKQGKQET